MSEASLVGDPFGYEVEAKKSIPFFMFHVR